MLAMSTVHIQLVGPLGDIIHRRLQPRMVRVEQHEPPTVIDPCMSHHLVDIALADILFGVIHPAGQAFPFGIDSLHDHTAAHDQDIGKGLEHSLLSDVYRPGRLPPGVVTRSPVVQPPACRQCIFLNRPFIQNSRACRSYHHLRVGARHVHVHGNGGYDLPPYTVGPMCCTPERKGITVRFSDWRLTPPLNKTVHGLT
ncbi:hypothetical protein GLX_23630 [Komagataeibacter medellinensis NBRC 3288]|uniref:Uncharacterized protein n=1 Tax=Komagataeibacter medellinensis (strain NBRC 3288 / BCRC 11682 / LMG 1693 / Kondo 51) TaxID=634177 RepID=G2I1G7_KOMMN|nr:hypothetical protein GLX_23630 [Komagataeibacter medellinensis NBRC 3288]